MSAKLIFEFYSCKLGRNSRICIKECLQSDFCFCVLVFGSVTHATLIAYNFVNCLVFLSSSIVEYKGILWKSKWLRVLTLQLCDLLRIALKQYQVTPASSTRQPSPINLRSDFAKKSGDFSNPSVLLSTHRSNRAS